MGEDTRETSSKEWSRERDIDRVAEKRLTKSKASKKKVRERLKNNLRERLKREREETKELKREGTKWC